MKRFFRKKSDCSLRETLHTRAFRSGSTSVLASLLVVAVAVGINLAVLQIPAQFTQFDTTTDSLFSISEQTETLLKNLDQDVAIYWIVPSGAEDSTLKQFLTRYEDLSSKVQVVKKDPTEFPTFTAQYTSETVTDNSLIVVSGERSKYISSDEIFVSDYSDYYTTGSATTSFCAESCLTAAINYVISDNTAKAYALTGHGEQQIDSAFETALKNQNMELGDLNLLTQQSVPEDCSCLIINAPERDLSQTESEAVLAYLHGGGSLLLITDRVSQPLENLMTITRDYGVTLTDGIVVEGDQNYCAWGTLYYLLPDLNAHEITNPLIDGKYNVLLAVAQGIERVDDPRDTLTIDSLLTTSDSAYSKVSGVAMTTTDREDGDLDGPFDLGVAISDTGEEETSRLVWFTSESLMDSSADETVSGANYDLLLNSVAWMCEQTDSISIHAKEITQSYLTLTGAQISRWVLVLVGLVPLCFLGIGIYVSVRKRRL